MMRTEAFSTFHPEVIEVLDRCRDLDDAKVAEIAASIEAVGQITPIVVFATELGDRIILVAEWHRLAAIRKLGHDKIDCRVVEGSDVELRLWEIAENLHRAELTIQERAAHVAEWIRLTEAKDKPPQVGEVSSGGRGNKGGVSAAIKELGISKGAADRAIKIDSIAPEAKEAAKKAGLDDNQSALLKIASYADMDQAEAVVDIAKARAARAKETARAKKTKSLQMLKPSSQASASRTPPAPHGSALSPAPPPPLQR